MSGLGGVAVMTGARFRPAYLKRALAGWAGARRFGEIRGFYIALGASGVLDEALEVIAGFRESVPVPVHVHVDDPPAGPWAPLAQMGMRAFDDPGVAALVVNDEDILPADDILEYYAWALDRFGADPRVLLVNAHSRCGQGWDGPQVRDSADADPGVVRLAPYFNAWSWATWRDRWESTILPQWDWDGSSARVGTDGGYDWNMALRTIAGWLAVIPDASRSEHIGDEGGLFSNDWSLAFSKAASFAAHRDPAAFRVEPASGSLWHGKAFVP